MVSLRLLFVTTCLLAVSGVASAQGLFLKDVNGQVLYANKYTNVEGSPYLNETWTIGSITALNDKVYANLKVRYDAYAGELEYEDKGKLYRLSSNAIKGFLMFEGDTLRFRKGFQPVGDNTANTFYQVLYDGAVKLLKQVKVSMAEIQVYNSAATTKQFGKSEQYFAVKPDGTLHKIQRNRKSLVSVFPDKKDVIEKAAKSNDLSQEATLVSVFAAINQ